MLSIKKGEYTKERDYRLGFVCSKNYVDSVAFLKVTFLSDTAIYIQHLYAECFFLRYGRIALTAIGNGWESELKKITARDENPYGFFTRLISTF